MTDEFRSPHADEDNRQLQEVMLQIAQRMQHHYGPLHAKMRPHHVTALTHDLHHPSIKHVDELQSRIWHEIGDGTYAGILIAVTMVAAALDELNNGGAIAAITKGIQWAIERAAEIEDDHTLLPSKPEELQRVAMTAALGNRYLGDKMLEAFATVGKDGVITIDSYPLTEQSERIEIEYIEAQFSSLVLPNWFSKKTIESPYILVSDSSIEVQDINTLLEYSRRYSSVCLCFSPVVSPEALDLAWHQYQQNTGTVIPIVPAQECCWEDCAQDLAILTGTNVFRKFAIEDRRSTITLLNLGEAHIVQCLGEVLNVVPGYKVLETYDDHVEQLRQKMYTSESEEDVEYLAIRLARLVGGIGLFKIYGEDPIAVERTTEMAEAALHATRSFVGSRGVPGGGAGYLLGARQLERWQPTGTWQAVGQSIVRRGLEAPVRCLVQQTESNSSAVNEIVDHLRRHPDQCYDVVSRRFLEWRNKGPMDSLGVVQVVIEAAGQAANTILNALSQATGQGECFG